MGMPALAFPASGPCQAEREAPSFSLLFLLLIQRTAAGGLPPWLAATARSGAAFLSVSPRGLRLRSAISLATRSTPAAHSHTAPGRCCSIYRQPSLDVNFQNALVRPLQAQKTYGSS